jgi:hypothetical protein
MNFGDTMAEKPTILQQIKKLDEERAKILEVAKTDALARAEEAISELTALGFDYEIVQPAREAAHKPRTARKHTAAHAEQEPPKVEPPEADSPKLNPPFEYI